MPFNLIFSGIVPVRRGRLSLAEQPPQVGQGGQLDLGVGSLSNVAQVPHEDPKLGLSRKAVPDQVEQAVDLADDAAEQVAAHFGQEAGEEDVKPVADVLPVAGDQLGDGVEEEREDLCKGYKTRRMKRGTWEGMEEAFQENITYRSWVMDRMISRFWSYTHIVAILSSCPLFSSTVHDEAELNIDYRCDDEEKLMSWGDILVS